MTFNTTSEMLTYALYQAEAKYGRTRKMVAKISGVGYNTIGSWVNEANKPEFHRLKSVISACGFHINYSMEAKV
tara:strand:- start:552 stop:773 length:222 start_codon:yes stop_codon:yes gene_type:complete